MTRLAAANPSRRALLVLSLPRAPSTPCPRLAPTPAPRPPPLRRGFSQSHGARDDASAAANVTRRQNQNQNQGGSAAQGSGSRGSGSKEGKEEGGGEEKEESTGSKVKGFLNSTAAEAALGASAGVILLGLAGMGYHKWYKAQVQSKMETAFDAGYDPVLALAESGGAKLGQLAYVRVPDRTEDELISRILRGEERGRYFLVLGPKGSGKTTSLIQAMAAQRADGVAFFEGHSDPSIVVDRFSEAINYSNNRDYLGNLVGLSDLSGMSTFQSLERALHKLEGALIRRRQRTGKPAVIIMNGAHLLGQGQGQGQDDEGTKLLTVLQQRAEKWASAGTATFIFTSNDYYVYDVLRRNSNRMDTLTFKDLSCKQSLDVLRSCRQQYWGEDPTAQDSATLDAVYRITGGRLSLLNKIARRRDMLRAAHQLVEDDLQFLLSKTGIIEDHDDDVMDEQKWSTCSWLLFLELAKRQEVLEKQLQAEAEAEATHGSRSRSCSRLARAGTGAGAGHEDDEGDSPASPQALEAPAPAPAPAPLEDLDSDGRVTVTESPATDPSRDLQPDVVRPAHSLPDVPNPSLTWGQARQVMTRPDYIAALDHLNLVHIDKHHHVRADSMPLLRAFRKVLRDDGEYEERLARVMDRVAAIESLGRTRELVWKEQGEGGRFLVKNDARGREVESWTLLGGDERLGREADGGEDDDGDAK